MNASTALAMSSGDQSAANQDLADVRLAAGGDIEAFERLYRRHVARVHTCLLYTSDAADDYFWV